jgi:hypothetical protein
LIFSFKILDIAYVLTNHFNLKQYKVCGYEIF